MYKSIKNWIDLPATLKPYIGKTGTGTKLFSDEESFLCYAEGKVEVVTNKDGAEVTSSTQLYVEGTSPIKELDEVVFEGLTRTVLTVSTFYRRGKADIKVVYLS